MDLLTVVVVVLGLIAAWRVMRVFELSEVLKGAKEERVTDKDNRFNAAMMVLGMVGFMGMVIYQFVTYQQYLLPPASSEHGPAIDKLFNVTMLIITIVFFICHIVLGWFALKYFGKKGRKVTYYPDNDKIEIIWTVIPTIVLTALIVYGLKVWDDVIYPEQDPDELQLIELYGKQFQWIARYPGEDGKLGSYSHKLIDADNLLGLQTDDNNSLDDIITSEMHFPVNKPIQLLMRSQDVIHSAYLPHFRVQMNCVPGMTTQFKFTPTKTTEDMRKELNDESFDYLVICNKICGAAHYTMKMLVVVESEEEYKKWLGEQKAFYTADAAQPEMQGTDENEENAESSEEEKVEGATI